MSTIIQRLPNSWRGEQTIFSVSSPVDLLPQDRLTDKHIAMLKYWRGKSHGGKIARRVDLDPLEIPRLLPNVLLWDVAESGDYLCRLAGSEVDFSMGVSMKGCWLSDIRCPLIAEAKEEFDAVRDSAMVSFAERTMAWLGKPYLYYRHLLMPLADESDEIHMLASLLTFHPISEVH